MRQLLLVLAFLALACAARAERADREKDMNAVMDHLHADDVAHTSTFVGNVVIVQGTMRLTADKVTVHQDPAGHKFYVAYGNPVTFRQKRDNVDEYVEGYALRAEFDDLNDILKLYEKARVITGANVINGEYIQYDTNKELAEVQGAPPGTKLPAGDARVKVTIVPEKKDAKDGKDAPKGAKEGKAPPPAPGVTLKPDPEMSPR
ncbi:MAG TPA: lipopolysaccharide transport periplasmic protein LptA [Usitatibacter sp.]|nr:lipopolysaccharide transport periplasmic protein LptA [Usitatibacter sp.]